MSDMEFKFDMKPVDLMMDDLKRLPQVLQERVIKGMVATGASLIRNAIKDNTPESIETIPGMKHDAGNLKRSIYQVRMADKCSPTLEVWKVDFRVSGKKGAFYAKFVEFGHFARIPTKGQKLSRKQRRVIAGIGHAWVPAHPFIRPAVEEVRYEVVPAMQQYLKGRLQDADAGLRVFKAVS